MSENERMQGEKYEKEAEKREKEQEKEEKSFEEKWRQDPLRAAMLAACLIWGGVVLLAESLGLLAAYEGLEGWPIVLIGAGLIVLAGVLIRLLVPAYRRPVTGATILGILLLGSGLDDLLEIDVVWPLLLIVGGFLILVRGFLKRS